MGEHRLEQLQELGVLTVDNHGSATLTDQGQLEVKRSREQRARERAEQAEAVQLQRATERRRACRNQLIAWACEQQHRSPWPSIHEFPPDHPRTFHGSAFTMDEVCQAATYLAGERLVEFRKTLGDDGTIMITHDGRKCVENFQGDVAAWEQHGRRSAGHEGTTINIGALTNNGGALAVGSADVTQNVIIDVDPVAMTTVIDMLLDELPALPLPDQHQAQVRDAIETLKQELARPAPHPHHVADAFGRIVGLLADAGRPVLTMVFLLLVRRYGAGPPSPSSPQ